MPAIMLLDGTAKQILLHNGKIAMHLNCCCGWNDTEGGSPWPPDMDAICDCYDTLPAVGSLTISGYPNNFSWCDQPCTGPFYNYSICYYDEINSSYELTLYDDYPGVYGECYLGNWQAGWTPGDPIPDDAGVLIEEGWTCVDPPDDRIYLTYLYQVRVWYLPCDGCPSSDPGEIWDLTRVRGQITIELKYQQLNYGASPYVTGGTLAYGSCDTACTHVARCGGGTCNIDFGFDDPVTVAFSVGT